MAFAWTHGLHAQECYEIWETCTARDKLPKQTMVQAPDLAGFHRSCSDVYVHFEIHRVSQERAEVRHLKAVGELDLKKAASHSQLSHLHAPCSWARE